MGDDAKLFVAGLAYSTRDDGLRAAFQQFGTLEEAKVRQKTTFAWGLTPGPLARVSCG
jgi:hypothetical protein